MAGFRNPGRTSVAVILVAVLCVVSANSLTTVEKYDEWLKHMSETSDPVSEENLKSLQSSVQHRADVGEGETQLTGFDAWVAKQQISRNSKFQQTSQRDSWKNDVQTIYVAQDGTGDFGSITDALNSIPQTNSDRKIIYIKAGTYYERFIIPDTQKYIALVGEGADKTVISGDAIAGDYGGDDELLKTYRSCTVCVNSDNFVAKDILIQNTAPAPQPGAELQQAVALRISGDKASFYNVAVLGAQDTLYDHQGRHYFQGCYIQGSIDFIFGNGRSYYKDCHLHSIAATFGSLTAQKRNESDMNTGFSFVNAQIDGTGIIYLGRAWGNFSRVVYSWSYLNDMIIPQGWYDWGAWQRDSEVFYATYQCYGPGSTNDQRVWYSKTLDDSQAKPFLTDSFVNGHTWIVDENDF